MPLMSFFRAAIVALLFISANITPSLAASFDHATRTGIVYLDKDGTPLFEIPSAKAGELEAGAEISVVISAAAGTQRLVQARTAGAAVLVAPGEGRLGRDGENNDTARYKLAIVGDDALPAGAVGLGIVGAADRCGVSDSVVSCDLESGGPPQFFRTCASREGLHFSVWSGKPLDGARRWHAYYYLGYDINPDCTAGDYAD